MINEFGIGNDALTRLALVVRAADTNRHDLAPEAAGLLAASLGLSRMYRDDLAQLEAMIRAQKGFRQSPEGDADANRVRAAYKTLGLESSASNSDIKKAYRRLMSQNHPDKIAGDNPGDEVLANAEQRTKEIRSAYEMLKARRSIR